jgi:hypothetical protein
VSIHDEFINQVLAHPQYEIIRAELCPDLPEPTRYDLGGGAAILTGGGGEETGDCDTWAKFCWYICQGPGYCVDAPEPIKKYLRRVGVEC